MITKKIVQQKRWSDLEKGDPIFKMSYINGILTGLKVIQFRWAEDFGVFISIEFKKEKSKNDYDDVTHSFPINKNNWNGNKVEYNKNIYFSNVKAALTNIIEYKPTMISINKNYDKALQTALKYHDGKRVLLTEKRLITTQIEKLRKTAQPVKWTDQEFEIIKQVAHKYWVLINKNGEHSSLFRKPSPFIYVYDNPPSHFAALFDIYKLSNGKYIIDRQGTFAQSVYQYDKIEHMINALNNE